MADSNGATRLCFVDTETTSLRPDRRAWEVGLIVRDAETEQEYHWFVRTEDLELGNADPFSLRVGKFYDRHPQMRGLLGRYPTEVEVLAEVEKLTRGAHLAGAVPSFDADVLGTRMRACGILPSWHYHLVDVEPLAAGWIAAHAVSLEREGQEDRARVLRGIAAPPWNSDELSLAVGVEPDEDARHTALGDARWARDFYDAVMGSSG